MPEWIETQMGQRQGAPQPSKALPTLSIVARVALWLAASLVVGSVLLTLVGGVLRWLSGASYLAAALARSAGAIVYYVLWWCIFFLPLHAVALFVWALVDRRAHTIERSWKRISVGLAFVAFPPALLLGLLDQDPWEGLLLGLCQWLALLLPRAGLPFLHPGAFRVPTAFNPFLDSSSSDNREA
jgi:hypothetical protein